jgi:chromosome segregation ATPase
MGRQRFAVARHGASARPAQSPALAPVEQKGPTEELLAQLRREREQLDARIKALEALLEERDRLSEQVQSIRELAEGALEKAEQRDGDLGRLQQALHDKDGKLTEQAERVKQLEATLRMLSEAEEKLEGR